MRRQSPATPPHRAAARGPHPQTPPHNTRMVSINIFDPNRQQVMPSKKRMRFTRCTTYFNIGMAYIFSYPMLFISVVTLISLTPVFQMIHRGTSLVNILQPFGNCVFEAATQPGALSYYSWIESWFDLAVQSIGILLLTGNNPQDYIQREVNGPLSNVRALGGLVMGPNGNYTIDASQIGRCETETSYGISLMKESNEDANLLRNRGLTQAFLGGGLIFLLLYFANKSNGAITVLDFLSSGFKAIGNAFVGMMETLLSWLNSLIETVNIFLCCCRGRGIPRVNHKAIQILNSPYAENILIDSHAERNYPPLVIRQILKTFSATFSSLEKRLETVVRDSSDGHYTERELLLDLGDLAKDSQGLFQIEMNPHTLSLRNKLAKAQRTEEQSALSDLKFEARQAKKQLPRNHSEGLDIKRRSAQLNNLAIKYFTAKGKEALRRSLENHTITSRTDYVHVIFKDFPVLACIAILIGAKHQTAPSMFASWQANSLFDSTFILRWIPLTGLVYQLKCRSERNNDSLSTAFIYIACHYQDYLSRIKNQQGQLVNIVNIVKELGYIWGLDENKLKQLTDNPPELRATSKRHSSVSEMTSQPPQTTRGYGAAEGTVSRDNPIMTSLFDSSRGFTNLHVAFDSFVTRDFELNEELILTAHREIMTSDTKGLLISLSKNTANEDIFCSLLRRLNKTAERTDGLVDECNAETSREPDESKRDDATPINHQRNALKIIYKLLNHKEDNRNRRKVRGDRGWCDLLLDLDAHLGSMKALTKHKERTGFMPSPVRTASTTGRR